MIRIAAVLGLLAAFAGMTPWALPAAKGAARLVMARDDPPALADLALAQLPAQQVLADMTAAIAAEDADLAASFLAVADARGIAVPAAQRAAVEALRAQAASAVSQMRNFGAGFITGTPEDMAGFAGAALGDIMVWGDIRDASREGWKLARGEDPDEILLGLSVAGLALTAGTYATLGGGAPARAGVSLLKVARRGGRLSAGLLAGLTRSVRETIDFAALRRAPAAVAALDGAALKSVVRAERLRDLGRMLGDVGTLEAKAGTRATLEGLRLAEGAGDTRRLARLAEAKGPQTLALLKSLGRGAFAITGAVLGLLWWGVGALVWLVGAIATFNALCVALVRPLWRRSRGRRRPSVQRPTPRAIHSV